jgi:hypothetical protein
LQKVQTVHHLTSGADVLQTYKETL